MNLFAGKKTSSFAVSPHGGHYFTTGGLNEDEEPVWKSSVRKEGGIWYVEMALPRKLFPDWSEVRLNVVHGRKPVAKEVLDRHLCPTHKPGSDPDRLPDWRPTDDAERLPKVVFE